MCVDEGRGRVPAVLLPTNVLPLEILRERELKMITAAQAIAFFNRWFFLWEQSGRR
jgi:hypothetical protein